MIETETLLDAVKMQRRFYPSVIGNDIADRVETAAWDIGLFHKAKALIEQKLLTTVKAGTTQIPFGMDGDEGALYLSGKADALQWVLEMLP